MVIEKEISESECDKISFNQHWKKTKICDFILHCLFTMNYIIFTGFIISFLSTQIGMDYLENYTKNIPFFLGIYKTNIISIFGLVLYTFSVAMTTYNKYIRKIFFISSLILIPLYTSIYGVLYGLAGYIHVVIPGMILFITLNSISFMYKNITIIK